MWTPLKGAVQPYAMLCRVDDELQAPPLIVERVKLYHPKVRVMSRYGGQRRDLILEPVSGPISASLEGASR